MRRARKGFFITVTGSRRQRSRWLLLLVGLVVASLLAVRFYRAQGGPGKSAGGPEDGGRGMSQAARQGNGAGSRPNSGPRPNVGGSRPQLVEVASVGRGLIREQISLVGSLKPKEQVEVVPKVTGRVERILVQVGDPVREGELIAELEGVELDQQVLRAEASLAVAQATLAQRQAELENASAEEKRASELLSQGLISLQARQTVQTRARVSESQVNLAQAQVRQARAELEELRIRQQQTRVYSPLSGWVGRRYVDPGALVNANTPLVTVLQLSTMVAEMSVPEKDLAKLRVGNRTTVTVDALEGRTYEGHLARISPLLDPATRSGSVEIEIPNADGQLKAGMFARIQMDLGAAREALVVPRDAVVLRGQQAGVNVLVSDRVQFRSIQTGASTEAGVEVLQGLQEGTTVVTRGSQGLKDGDLVVIQGKHSVPEDSESRS